MKLELNIYEKGKVKKKYTAETCDISFGVIEDLIDVVDLEKINDNMEIAKMALKAIPLLKPFLKDVFIGLTDEEIRKTKITELIEVFTKIFSFTYAELTNLSTSEGN